MQSTVLYQRLGWTLLALVVVGGTVGWWLWQHRIARLASAEDPAAGRCVKRLDRAMLERSLELGRGYLLYHQKPEGNFDYEYDWQKQQLNTGDNQVRQAGALWGMGLFAVDAASPELKASVERGMAFFDRFAVTRPDGRICVTYPGESTGYTGTQALVALARIEYLRAFGATLSDEIRRAQVERLKGYLEQLVQSIADNGLWYGEYSVTDCQPKGASSPYSDGEALLALVKAAKYLERRDLEAVIVRAAENGYRLNVEEALKAEPDSDTTKGYYQWSSMAFYELYTSGWANIDHYGDWVIRLADWMIDVHKTLRRTRNTAYAYEGITHAYQVAHLRGDRVREAKYGCVMDTGLRRLMSWQLGHPLANSFVQRYPVGERRALGGVQNEAEEPAIRIDVVQHQMHATELARRFLFDQR